MALDLNGYVSLSKVYSLISFSKLRVVNGHGKFKIMSCCCCCWRKKLFHRAIWIRRNTSLNENKKYFHFVSFIDFSSIHYLLFCLDNQKTILWCNEVYQIWWLKFVWINSRNIRRKKYKIPKIIVRPFTKSFNKAMWDLLFWNFEIIKYYQGMSLVKEKFDISRRQLFNAQFKFKSIISKRKLVYKERE